MSRITTNSNPRGDLDLPQTKLQIPLWYPTFEVDDSPASTPPRIDMPDRVDECRVNFDTWGQRSILMPK